MKKINLSYFSVKELEDFVKSWGEPQFRARQLLRWIWKEGVCDFNKMTNLSVKFRNRLLEECVVEFPEILLAQKSEDGTIKYLLKLNDGKTVETVWIPSKDQKRVTLCVSTQVGCKMGCTFCLTAQQKVERNLLPGEIAGQLWAMPHRQEVTNIVMMGMGEPFDNYDNLMGGISLLMDVEALEIGPRKITVSTSGLVPAIKKFVTESKARLAVSLNAPNDAIRSQIMPINRAYNMEELLGTLRRIAHPTFPKASKDFGVTFEYILIRGLNDRPEHAHELAKQLRGIPCMVNILLYNENPNVPFQRPLEEDVAAFRAILSEYKLLNFVRQSRGRDISAACGQLASIHKRKSAETSAAQLQ